MRITIRVAAVIFAMCIGGLVQTATAADDPAATGAKPPTTRPMSIFDFGLEPFSKPEEEKSDKADRSKPAKPPADAKVTSPTTPIPANASGDLAEVIKACHVDANGELTADRPVTLGLKGTEGKHFILSGDFYLAPEPTRYNSGNVTFRLRRVSSLKSIDLNITVMRVKRIMLEGQMVKRFAEPMKFEGLEREKWLPFKIDAGEKAIVVNFGKLQGIAKGPVATEGTNAINLSPGAKLRNLKLVILDD